jgi:hypothetical protein
MIASLPVEVDSSDRLGVLIWELQQYIATRREDTLRQASGPRHMSKGLSACLQQTGVSSRDVTALETVLNELKEVRSSSPKVRIATAVYADQGLRGSLIQWFRQEIHPLTLCSFIVQSDIGGGAIVRIGVKEYDLSMRHAFLKNRQKVSEVLQRGRE